MSIEEECAAIQDQLTVGPISPAEYRRLLTVRKGAAYPAPGPYYEMWRREVCRFLALFPRTLEREMWHEAGHAVVGHVLGCQICRIRRDHEGTPGVVIKRPEGWTGLDEGTMTVAGWIAEALKMAPEYSDPTEEVSNLAKEFRSPTGELLPLEERIKYVEMAEHRAHDILVANWDVVERIALRGIQRLPIEKGELRRLLEGTQQASN